jgi:hypothetical protein
VIDMFNPTTVVASAFGEHLSDLYTQHFATRKPQYAAFIGGATRLVLERLSNCDALYHNTEHTVMVTLAGQHIIRGRLLTEALQPEDWIHYIVALLIHDIGYVRGVCKGDRSGSYVVNEAGDRLTPPRGASDAWFAPYHVERAKIYARERFASSEFIDEERIVRAIEYTRFPVPVDADYAETDTERALVRAADLIGQMGDPFYHRKISALYAEFVETGVARQLGYETAFDLFEKYPDFFWSQVQPYIGSALRYLELTSDGKVWVAQLYNHVFQAKYKASHLGPFSGTPPANGK